ncbi:MAG: protein phosphatase 2C domain-containing protein [Actinomycetia bacterium]|nr:protein phosphatase 2C domain-containing protein [Actinomycetes bacterium]
MATTHDRSGDENVKLIAGARSDVGKVRSHNEDSYLVGKRIWAVADGMGGHAAGEVASTIVTERLRAQDRRGALDLDVITHVIDAINEAILEHGRTHPAALGLGSTVSGIASTRLGDVRHWIVFNIGDSRVYRYANGRLTRETVDHNEAEELIESGELDPEQAKTHPSRSVLTRALGSVPGPQPDVLVLPQRRDDTFLICSDGLTSEVPDSVLLETLRDYQAPDEAADRLVQLALDNGAKDNVTAIVVAVRSGNDTDTPTEESVETTIPKAELQVLNEH